MLRKLGSAKSFGRRQSPSCLYTSPKNFMLSYSIKKGESLSGGLRLPFVFPVLLHFNLPEFGGLCRFICDDGVYPPAKKYGHKMRTVDGIRADFQTILVQRAH